jgi:hypothetical protein
VVIAQESGDYAVATTMVPPNACQLHDNMQKSIRNLDDPLQQAVIRHSKFQPLSLTYLRLKVV